VLEETPHYVYDPDTGTYTFRLPGVSKAFNLSRAQVDQVFRDYSEVAAEKGATLTEVGRTLGLPHAIMDGVRRALGLTHKALPWSAETLAEKGDEELLEEAGQLRQLRIYSQIERQKWNQIKADADKWRRAHEELVRPLLGWLAEHAPTYAPPQLQVREARDPWALLLGLTDEHWNLQAAGWSRAIQRRVYLDLLGQIFSEAVLFGRPERIIFPVGSDGIHVDSAGSTTTSGTQLFTEAPPAEGVSSWVAYKVEQIDLARQVAPVDVWLWEGNHDRHSTAWAGEVLAAWYRNADDVTVHRFDDDRLPGGLVGSTLLCLHHGDEHTVKDLGLIVPKQWPVEWGAATHRLCCTGHQHSPADLPSKSGLRVIRWATAVAPCAWTKARGFAGSWRGLQAERISLARGHVGTLAAPLEA
jgi:hypothetical protein